MFQKYVFNYFHFSTNMQMRQNHKCTQMAANFSSKVWEIHLRKENKSLLHFQRIANHLENMNSEEANKRVDYLHQLQKYAEI